MPQWRRRAATFVAFGGVPKIGVPDNPNPLRRFVQMCCGFIATTYRLARCGSA